MSENKIKEGNEVLLEKRRDYALFVVLLLMISKFIKWDFMDIGEEGLAKINEKLDEALTKMATEQEDFDELIEEDKEDDLERFKKKLTKLIEEMDNE